MIKEDGILSMVYILSEANYCEIEMLSLNLVLLRGIQTPHYSRGSVNIGKLYGEQISTGDIYGK